MLIKLRSLLGGRAAEEVACNTMTNGASQDIQQATGMAKNMVCLYGMSEELGLMATAFVQNEYLDGSARMDCSDQTAARVDAAVQRLLNEAYAESKQILQDNRALLDEISLYLLQKETITGDELMAFVNGNSSDIATAADFVDDEGSATYH